MAITRVAACAALASSSSSFLSSSSVWHPASSGTTSRRNTAGNAPATFQQSLVVKCGGQDDLRSKEVNFTRRKVFSLATLSVLLSAQNAQAKDVPLFGFNPKKQLEAAKKVVDTGVQGLTEQGGKGFEGVASSVKDTFGGIETPSVSGFSPVLQAGSVLGAEFVAVVVASSVVSGLVSVPSK